MIPFVNADALLLFLPALCRVGGLLVSGPLLKHVQIPLVVKAGFALYMTVAIWPLLSAGPAPPIENLWSLGLLAGTELLLGLMMGIVATVLFAGIEYAGQIVGTSIGLAIVNVLDPVFDAQISIISRVYGLFGLAIFFAIGAHLVLVNAVLDSFVAIPVGSVVFAASPVLHVLTLGGEIFVTAVRIAAPILAVMLLTEVGMGLIVRTVPQMNVFIVGFPLKIGLGFALMVVTMPMVGRLLEGLFLRMDQELSLVLRGM